MDYVYSVITILAGCGVFLLGFKLLSDNMEKLAGNGLKRLFNKTSDKKLVGVGLGAAATAVVQSSDITTGMVIGHYVFKTSRNDHHGREHRHDDHGADRGIAGV